MSMETHTPGPWTIIPATKYDGDDDDLVGAYTSPAGIEGADGNPVCAFGIAEGSGTLFENEADYHLIAAAPDLLAALDTLVIESGGKAIPNDRLTAARNAAIAALAKARPSTESN